MAAPKCMCTYKGNVDSWLIQLQSEKTNILVRANRIAKMSYAAFNAFSFEGKIKLKKIDSCLQQIHTCLAYTNN